MNYVSSSPRKAFIVKKGKLRTTPIKCNRLSKQINYLKNHSKIDKKGNIVFSEQIKVVE